MNFSDWSRAFLSTVSGHPVLERLFFASVEFAALVVLVWFFIRIARIKSARLMSLLWLVALAKPIVSLGLGSPLPVLQVPVLKVDVANPAEGRADQFAANQPPNAARQMNDVHVAHSVSTGAVPSGREFPDADFPFARTPDEGLFARSAQPAEVAGLPAAAPNDANASTAATAPAAVPASGHAATIVIALWLAGVVFFAFRSALDRFRLRRLIHRAVPPDEALSARYIQLAAAFRVRHAPRLKVTDELESPALVGSLVPTILIPRWLVSEQDCDKIDWALRHELMHWKLFDSQAGLIREIAQALFYFHPAVWWAGRQWEVAAELACDRAIISDDAESRDYAAQLYGMLVEIRDRRRFPVQSGLFATRTQIRQRIAALVQGPCRTRAHLGAFALAAVAAVSLAALSIGGTFAEKELPVEASIASDSPETDSAASNSPETGQPNDLHDDVTFTYSGTVVDERGQPVAGARIALDYWRKVVPPVDARATAVSDDHGKFQFSRSKGDFSDGGDGMGHVYAVLIATKDGFGFAAGPALSFETTGRLAAAMTPEQRQSMGDHWGQKTNVLSMIPDDIPVRGRIVNIEGQPVVGAKIEAVCVWGGKTGTLEAWENATRKHGANYYTTFENLKELCNGHFVSGPRAVVVPEVRTDADGWFTLKGLGRERIAETFVSGPGIETKMIHVRSRRGEVVTLPDNERSDPGRGDPVFYPAEFTRVAGPSVPIAGRVTDSRTQEPLAGVVITADQIATSSTQGTFEAAYIRTVADADGRYRLDGLPLGQNVFVALPPFGSRYIPAGFTANLSAGSKPLVQDIRLTAGVLVHGHVIDGRTDKPVQGNLQYFVTANNPHLPEAEGFNKAHLMYHYRSDHAGRFEIPVLHGRGILAFSAYDHEQFPRGAGADQIDAPTETMEGARFLFKTQPFLCTADNYHLLTPLDPPPGTKDLSVDMTLTSGVSIPGRVRAPDGQALSGCHIYGESYGGWSSNRPEALEIKGYFQKQGRRLAFYHPGRNLVGEQNLIGAAPQKLEITLHPGATLVGRVLDADGMPLENATINDASLPVREVDRNLATKDLQRGMLPPAADGRSVLTDAQGRFELKGIIPGLKYAAEVRAPLRQNGATNTMILGPIFDNVTAKAGETKNLGDLQVKPYNVDQPQAAAAPPVDRPVAPPVNEGKKDASAASAGKKETPAASRAKTTTPSQSTGSAGVGALPGAGESGSATEKAQPAHAGATPDDITFTYAGTVVDPDGKPVAGAKLHFCYYTREPRPDLRPLATTAADGTFRFSRRKSDFDKLGESGGSWKSANLVATADGFGFAIAFSATFETTGRLSAELSATAPDWQARIAEEFGPPTTVLKLVGDDVPVRMRVVDIEGRPAAGMRLDVIEVRKPKAETLTAWEQEAARPGAVADMGYNGFSYLVNGPRATVVASQAIPDPQGRIQVNGLGKERIAKVRLSGPGIESAFFHVRTRLGETIRLPRAAGRNSGDEIYYPAEFTHVAGPSQPVVGTITAAKTRAPLAGCVIQGDLTSSADGRQYFQVGVLTAQTDAEGRYRLEGLAPGDHRLVVLPPPGSAFLPAGFTVKTDTKPAAVTRDAQLFAGVRIRGTVTDSRTGEPIVGGLSYTPFSNNPAIKSAIGFEQVGQYQLGPYYYQSDVQGRFELPALPGKGVLAFTAHNHTSFPVGTGADAVKAVAAADGAGAEFPGHANLVSAVDLDAQAEGSTVILTLASGHTIKGTVETPEGERLGDYLIYGESQNPFWYAKEGETFEVTGYFPSEKRRLMFFHAARNLVGVYELAGEPPETLKIVLRPGAVLKGRIVDKTGRPLEDAELVNMNTVMASPAAARPIDDPAHGVLATGFEKVGVLRTGADGRFEIRGIIPGLKYSADAIGHTDNLPAFLGKVFTDVTAKPGETKDLGDLRVTSGNSDAAPPDEKSKTATQPRDKAGQSAATTISIKGVVLKPDGSPAAGATVRAAAGLWAMLEPIVGAEFKSPMSETKADAQGRFSISFPTQPFGDLSQLDERWRDVWKRTEIAASLPGFGPAWLAYNEIDSQQPVTLRLVEDLPVRGRVVDLEGRPVAGTTVKVSGPQASKNEDLSAWIEGIKAGELPWTVYDKASRSVEPRLVGTPSLVTTDQKGMFEIQGLGRERIVNLTFEGDIVAHRSASAVTRNMQPIRRTVSPPPFEGSEPVFGADFTYTADPARIIEGVVRDAKSGKHLAGVSVESYKLVGYPYSNHRVLKTKTDNLGRFRLIGMPKGSGNKLLLVPNDEQPYFMREVDVPDPVGLGPAKMEIDLHRGLWITGRVTDKATGKPVPGVRLHYLPFRSNEYAQKTPEFDSNGNVNGDQSRYVANSEGTYRLVGLPGRAIIGAESVLQNYRSGVGYDAIDAPKYEKTDYFDTYRNPINPSPKWPSVMREINPAADAESVSLDLQLDPGKSLRIRVVGPGGEPLTGVSVTGLTSGGYVAASQEPILVASNFGPGESRTILFHHQERNIGRVVTVDPKQLEAGEMTAQLQPCATLVGRILNSDGLPITGMAIRPDVLPFGDFGNHLPKVATDAEGRFRVTLLPGCQYSFGGEGGGFQFVTVARELSIEPGETKDLGTLTIDKDGKVMQQAASGPAKATMPSTEYSVLSTQSPGRNNSASGKSNAGSLKVPATTISGTIQTPDGKPAAKACVAVIGSGREAERGGDPIPYNRVLGEAVCDNGGHYRMQLSGVSSKTQQRIHVIARSDDSGLAWRRIDPDLPDIDVSFDLPAERVIRGRFIDTEGQPAASVRIVVSSVLAARQGASGPQGVEYDDPDHPRAWPQPATSDQAGRFVIRNLPANHLMTFYITGTDRFAPESSRLSTASPEQDRQPGDTFRAFFKDIRVDEETVLVLAPAQIVEGHVRYADSGQPAPHARLTIGGAAVSADAQGRYRINPYPGTRLTMTVFPPDGVPYLARKLRDIARKGGALVNQVDVPLPRGVFIRGRVIEAGTNTPVAGAAIQYIPERRNNRNAADDIITGREGIQLSGTDGAFEIAVLPGPGTLLVDGPRGKYVLQEIGSRQLDQAIPGGERNYAHAIRHVNPDLDAVTPDETIALHRGATVSGRITTTTGEPVEHALILTRLTIGPGEIRWNGWPQEALGGRFELSGLAEGIEYPVHFLDPKNGLGATVLLNAGDKSPTVKLLPCGQASATIIDDSGKPMVGYFPWLDMVVTPGPDKFEAAVDAPGVLAGDAAYVVNIDRTNYQNAAPSDDEGRITYPALIPGARYRIITYEKGVAINLKEFVAESGKTLELGKIVYAAKKGE